MIGHALFACWGCAHAYTRFAVQGLKRRLRDVAHWPKSSQMRTDAGRNSAAHSCWETVPAVRRFDNTRWFGDRIDFNMAVFERHIASLAFWPVMWGCRRSIALPDARRWIYGEAAGLTHPAPLMQGKAL